jgi:hypothetical protein
VHKLGHQRLLRFGEQVSLAVEMILDLQCVHAVALRTVLRAIGGRVGQGQSRRSRDSKGARGYLGGYRRHSSALTGTSRHSWVLVLLPLPGSAYVDEGEDLPLQFRNLQSSEPISHFQADVTTAMHRSTRA